MGLKRYPSPSGYGPSTLATKLLREQRSAGVVLPTTEAAADANTFVCEFVGGSSANETGVGLGLTGADLVLTQTGSVGASSGGYRPLANNTQAFSSTVPFLQAFINGSEWSLLRKVRNVATTNGGFISRLTGTANIDVSISPASLMRATFTNTSSPNAALTPSTLFANNVEYWIAMWKKSSILHFGYVLVSSANPPTGWDSFPRNQRSCLSGYPDFTADAWGSNTYVIGLPSATGVFEIGTLVASKYGLSAAPV